MGDDLRISFSSALYYFSFFSVSLCFLYFGRRCLWCYVGFPTSCYCTLGVSWVLLANQSCGSGWQEQCAWPCRPQMFQHVISLSPPLLFLVCTAALSLVPDAATKCWCLYIWACSDVYSILHYSSIRISSSLFYLNCSRTWPLGLQGPPFPYFCHRYTDAPIRCTIVSIVVKSI